MPERATVADDEASRTVPDLLLPSQYFDRIRPRRDLDGPRRLMLAVLEDALHLFVTYAGARHPRGRALFSKTEVWFEDRGGSGLFSFEQICAVLDLDPDYLRRGLRTRRWRSSGVQGTDGRQPQPTAVTRGSGRKVAAA